MKFSTLTLSLLSAATASADVVTLITESSNSETTGKGLQFLHEGAGFNYAFLNDNTTATYNVNGDNVTQYLNYPILYPLGEWEGLLISSLGAPFGVGASVNDGYLTVNGSNSVFYACKPGTIKDAYQYGQHMYTVAIYPEGQGHAGCSPIKIKADPASGSAASSSSAAPSSAAPASSSALPTSAPVAAKQTSGHFNATVTTETTKYTTIECSTPTTFAYGNSTYTVSSATTLTVEDCSCTAGPSAPVASASATASAPPAVNGASGLRISAVGALAAAGLFFL